MNPPPGAGDGYKTPWYLDQSVSDEETVLALAVLLFTLISMLIVAVLFKRHQAYAANDILRVFALILIIGGTLFLVSAGFDAQQIAPAFGLLGSVAGYILGATRHTSEPGRGNNAKDAAKQNGAG